MKTKIRMQLFAGLLCAALLCAFLPANASAAGSGSWDGKTIDVSWYNKTDKSFYIGTPAQLAGLAAIVNGIYNADIKNIIGSASCIADNYNSTGTAVGSNNKSTSSYHLGSDDFNGKTVYLTADLDMGGVYDSVTGTWSGPNYMPVGGQYLMEQNNSATKLSSSFCGTLDGQGHTIYNIYCSRRCTNGNFGDGESVGLIGRLGVHDDDPANIRPVNPTVRNLAITGYIYANRSVGGIVGKIGKTSYNNADGSTGGIIENCANFATVSNTDAKGCGGICGASWNGGIIRSCYNAGTISSTYVCPTGGIGGSNEITIQNCYNVGSITAAKDNFAMGIGTNNGGGVDVNNCYWLTGTSAGGGYYGKTFGTVTERTAGEMKSADLIKNLGDAFTADTHHINGGYPILKWQATSRAYGDVANDSWYASYVSFVTERGLFDAATPAVFSPNAPMTRAMLVTALYRLAGSPAVSAFTQFIDVKETAPYADAVAWAYEKGVVNGTSKTTFSPGSSITREQIMAMFWRYAGNVAKADMTENNDLSAFTDKGGVSDWAASNMRWAVGAGLINGTSKTTLTPQGTATRAEVAAMVQRLSGFLK